MQHDFKDELPPWYQVVCGNRATPGFCHIYYSDDKVCPQGCGEQDGGKQSAGCKTAGGSNAGGKNGGGQTSDSQAGVRRRLQDISNCAGCLQICNCQMVGLCASPS